MKSKFNFERLFEQIANRPSPKLRQPNGKRSYRRYDNDLVIWSLRQDTFTIRTMMDAFPHLDYEALREWITRKYRLGFLVQIHKGKGHRDRSIWRVNESS